MEKYIENLIYSTRWLLAPIYLGLSIALIFIGVKFFEMLWHMIPYLFTASDSDLILKILALIDLTLVGGLLVMVMFSGYENFVSKLDIDDNKEKLSWLGKMDTGTLKSKVAASIVAISSIHLLKLFMTTESEMSNERLLVYVVMHLTFVTSAFAMGYLDKITHKH